MTIRISLLAICLLTATTSFASESSDYLVTRQYYSTLIAAEPAPLAELSLFTSMLPKGGDIHHHYSGAIYAETYLDWVDAEKYCIYNSNDAILNAVKFTIETTPARLQPAARAICISADAVRKDDDFYRELLQRWSDKDYDNHFHEEPPPDKQFFDTFGYFGAVSGHAYNEGLKSLKARALEENVGYLETMLKSGPVIEDPALSDLLNSLRGDSPAAQVEQALARAYDFLARDARTAASVAGYVRFLRDAAAGIDADNFRLRFLAYVSRNSSPARIFTGLYASFAAAASSREVVGVNFVGPENGYLALRDYDLHMQMFAFLKRHFPQVKLSLHAGELALGMVPPESLRSHIRAAVLVAGADRIGHGVDLPYERDAWQLMDVMRQRKTAVEINLTSNAFILGIKDEAHPLPLYRRYGVPFVISTDDPGVSRSNLSAEYALFVRRYKPGYDELKSVAYNSIRYSFLPEAEKREEMARLERRFRDFERSVAAYCRKSQSSLHGGKKPSLPGRGKDRKGKKRAMGQETWSASLRFMPPDGHYRRAFDAVPAVVYALSPGREVADPLQEDRVGPGWREVRGW